MKRNALLLLTASLLGACAANRPIVYQNTAAPGALDAAIAECSQLAANAGAHPSSGVGTTARDTAAGGALGAATGAVGGAIAGNAGSGAAIGAATGATATLLRKLFNEPAPNPAYRAYVERCLRDRGFDVVGWQ